MGHWNMLPREVLGALALEVFKAVWGLGFEQPVCDRGVGTRKSLRSLTSQIIL